MTATWYTPVLANTLPSNHARYIHKHNEPHTEHVEQLSQLSMKHVTAGNDEAQCGYELKPYNNVGLPLAFPAHM